MKLEQPLCMMLNMTVLALLLMMMAGLSAAEPILTMDTAMARFGVDANGSLNSIMQKNNGVNYLAPEQPCPLLSIRIQGKLHSPDKATWDEARKQLTLFYTDINARGLVSAEVKAGYVVFEAVDIQCNRNVELVLWGPYPTTIGEIIGETVGVVRNREYAIGIQSLNAKTLGGYPTHENDIEADFGADDRGFYPNLPVELLKGQGYRGDTARPTAFGSVLQAYCRNRSQVRIIPNWGHEKYLVPAYQDGGVMGSRIALFACPTAEALKTIGEIEIAEGLPHPMLDGQWGKLSPEATVSYLIVDFSEKTVDRAIEMTKRAGLKYLYHSSPFETWGHFQLKKELFPNGWDGLKACVEKAHRSGVRLGLHTLSNFITPNDAYVTPTPDPRLACIGASDLSADVDAEQKEIPVAAPDYFNKNTAMNTVVIGKELIRYGMVSAQPPWRLLKCERGAYSTKALAHSRGAAVGKLMDHDYKVFLTDANMAQEVSRNIAALFNHTGALQLSFDGLEGNWSTGHGQYGRTLFTKAWYDALSPELRGRIINDASNPGHFNWHIYTRMNWGEPWYAGFRESQTLYRFKNQVYFERNLMPHMLGWFALRPDTSIEDAEWLLARASGFDAGFALASSLASTAQLTADASSAEAAKRYGATLSILEAIKQWETARLAGAFGAEIKASLRDNRREFHLAPAGKGQWTLYEAHNARFTHDASQPSDTEFQFQNVDARQPLQWIMRFPAKLAVKGFFMEINGKCAMELKDVQPPAGGSIQYGGGSEAIITDASWKEVARIPVNRQVVEISNGIQQIKVGCVQEAGVKINIELRSFAPGKVCKAIDF